MKLPFSLRLISPLGILLVSATVWTLCYLTPLNSYTFEQNSEAYLLLAGYIAAFVVGTLVWRKPPPVPTGIRIISVRAVRIGFTVLLLIAAAGLAMRYFDLFFVKHIQDYDSTSAFRISEVEEGAQAPGAMSAFSILLYPVSLVCYMLSLFLHQRLHLWQRVLAVFCLLGYGGYTVLQGGRAALAVAGIMIVVALILRGVHDPDRRLEGARLKVLGLCMALGACAFVAYSAYIVVSRVQAVGIQDPTALLDVAEQTRGFKLNDPYYTMVKTGSPLVSGAVTTGSSLTYYINHGVFDFSELYDSERGRRPLGGVMQFGPVVRFLDNAGVDVPSVAEAEDRIPHPGLFYTFFGNVLMDWGVFGGLVYCLIFGMFVQALWLKARTGSLLCLLLYPFFACVVAYFPLSDMIVGAYGLFTIFGIVVSVALLHFFELVFKARAKRRAVLQAA